jgi:hypothetical protein
MSQSREGRRKPAREAAKIPRIDGAGKRQSLKAGRILGAVREAIKAIYILEHPRWQLCSTTATEDTEITEEIENRIRRKRVLVE